MFITTYSILPRMGGRPRENMIVDHRPEKDLEKNVRIIPCTTFFLSHLEPSNLQASWATRSAAGDGQTDHPTGLYQGGPGGAAVILYAVWSGLLFMPIERG